MMMILLLLVALVGCAPTTKLIFGTIRIEESPADVRGFFCARLGLGPPSSVRLRPLPIALTQSSTRRGAGLLPPGRSLALADRRETP